MIMKEKKGIFQILSEWLGSFLFETEEEAPSELIESESQAI